MYAFVYNLWLETPARRGRTMCYCCAERRQSGDGQRVLNHRWVRSPRTDPRSRVDHHRVTTTTAPTHMAMSPITYAQAILRSVWIWLNG